MTSGRVPIDGGELQYERAGSGDPVVLLHGGLLDLHSWDEQTETLSVDHAVLRFDARGHGRSTSRAGDYTEYEDLRHLLDHLGLARVTLIGLSLGARVSIDFALAYPHRVRRLVAASPGISGLDPIDPFLVDRFEEADAAIDAGDVDAAVEAFLRALVDGPRREPSEVDPSFRDRMRASMRRTLVDHGSGHGRPREVGALDRLGELAAPVLVIVGDLDAADSLHAADLLVARADDARSVVLPGAGHMVNLEARSRFEREVDAFLAARAD